ncbi:MAG: M48 family metallopeptidase [Pseudomonadota bacterium]
MDPYVYEGLVERLEAQSYRSPSAFRGKVILISSAAYMALFAVLLGLALLLYFGIQVAQENHRSIGLIRLAILSVMLLPLFFVVLRMFSLRLEPPKGHEIQRADAPKLFELLDQMRKKLKGPKIHHVLIDREYNAAIAQLPKFGLFGDHTNYLVLGLPYLMAAPPKEMLATIAHEYGHLCGGHGQLSARVYRQRKVFGALHEQVNAAADSSFINAGMASALNRFMPYYNAYTFVLSRQDEYEADRTASDLVGASANASGLIRDTLLGSWIRQEFWPRLFKQADMHAQPLFLPYTQMRSALNDSYDEWATSDRLRVAWQQKSDLHDTHPSMRDRVEATGKNYKLPSQVEVAAAEGMLGPLVVQLAEKFDLEWWEEERKTWETRNRYAQRSIARLHELCSLPLSSLKLQDLQERALLTAEFESPKAAKPILEHLLRQTGGPFPKAAYFYGRILLGENHDAGLDQLEAAAKNDRSLIEPAASAGYAYLLERQGEQAAQLWWAKVMPEQK